MCCLIVDVMPKNNFEVGDIVRFVNTYDMREYIGEIRNYYAHNSMYEIEIIELYDGVMPEELPETGATDMPLEKYE